VSGGGGLNLGRPLRRQWETGPVTGDDGAVSGRPRNYADHRPYADPPGASRQSDGPDRGTTSSYRFGSTGVRSASTTWRRWRSSRRLPDRALRGGSHGDVERYLNGALLVELRPRLWLPQRLRRRWEERFRELIPRDGR